jgi:DNA-binding transcriptional LysR family regulator
MIDVPEDIAYLPIFTYEPFLITAPDHPLAGRRRVELAEVAEHGLVLPPRHLSTWRIVDLVFRKHGLDYRVVLEAGGWEVIKRFVELGLGVSIVTGICLTERDRVARIPLGEHFPTRSYGVVMRRHKHLSPQALRFLLMLDPEFEYRAGDARDPALRAPGRRRRGAALSTDLMGHDRDLP